MMRGKVMPDHSLRYSGKIDCFEICYTDFAHNLICIAGGRRLSLLQLSFPEESEDNSFHWETLKEMHHESRAHAITFAPETSILIAPKTVTFCTADADFFLRIFRTNLKDSDTVQELKGHANYVNDVAWDYSGEYLASVSDDHTCKIWSSESDFETATTFCLSSAGMSVKWHPEESHKMLVAEKKGVIHLYNVRSQQAFLSVETPKCPLMSADWSAMDHMCVIALAGGDVVCWDLRRPCSPTDVKNIHEDCGRVVRFSPNSEVVFASAGRPSNTLKVFTTKSNVALVEARMIMFNGLAWHYRLPYVGVAHDRKISFWKVQVK